MDNILLKAIIAVLGISITAGPVGSFVLWKKISYFGDTISHAALLGVTLAIVMGLNHIIGILLISVFPSLILLQIRNFYTKDVLLNITSNFSLALSLILFSIFNISNINIISLLFGDILTIDYTDIASIYTVAITSTVIITLQWKKWIFITFSTELAQVAKLNTKLLEIEFIALLSILIAISINIVGILLTTSLLIIPSAAARAITTTPVTMVLASSIICFTSSIIGILCSWRYDIPTGPSIIITSGIILIVANIFSYTHKYRLSKP